MFDERARARAKGRTTATIEAAVRRKNRQSSRTDHNSPGILSLNEAFGQEVALSSEEEAVENEAFPPRKVRRIHELKASRCLRDEIISCGNWKENFTKGASMEHRHNFVGEAHPITLTDTCW